MFLEVSLIPVIVAAVASMIFGALWYSPALMGTLWMKEAGVKESNMKERRKSIAAQGLNTIVVAFVLAYLIKQFNITTTDAGIELTFLFWLGFIATSQAMGIIFEKTSYALYAVNVSYHLISLMIMTMVITSWK
jgi:membrane-associated HD superfamily phosphohydrolase